jgi:AraC-like DNA-binding protein
MNRKTGKMSYTVQNLHNMHERFYSVIEEFAQTSFPLYICYGGNSVWKTGVSITKHNNDCFYVELVTAGNLCLRQNGREYIVEPGTVFMNHVNADLTYGAGPAGFVHKRFVGIRGALLESALTCLGIDRYDTVRSSAPCQCAMLLRRAIGLMRNHSPGHMLQLALLGYEILLLITLDITGVGYPQSVRTAIDYMHQNIHRMVTIEELAKESGMSQPHLFRLFRHHLGSTPLQFFIKTKMAYASTLLSHSPLSVKEISVRLGYEEPSYFTRVFRQTQGIAPGAYRTGNRNVDG